MAEPIRHTSTASNKDAGYGEWQPVPDEWFDVVLEQNEALIQTLAAVEALVEEKIAAVGSPPTGSDIDDSWILAQAAFARELRKVLNLPH